MFQFLHCSDIFERCILAGSTCVVPFFRPSICHEIYDYVPISSTFYIETVNVLNLHCYGLLQATAPAYVNIIAGHSHEHVFIGIHARMSSTLAVGDYDVCYQIIKMMRTRMGDVWCHLRKICEDTLLGSFIFTKTKTKHLFSRIV